MRRSTFLKIAVLSLGLLALAWAPAARAVAASSVGGVTFGEWNLPSFGSGFATGALLDQNNNTVFKMKAKLTETPSPALALRQGNLNGELDDGAPGFPIFFVNGSWKALALTGEGSFEAIISKQVSPLGPIVQIGKMAGKFSDPPSFPDQVGKYKGEWKAQL